MALPIPVDLGFRIMKMTIKIAHDLFERAQDLARKEETTFQVLVEESLRLMLAGKCQNRPKKFPPLVTFGAGGLTDEFKDWSWDRIRAEIYRPCSG